MTEATAASAACDAVAPEEAESVKEKGPQTVSVQFAALLRVKEGDKMRHKDDARMDGGVSITRKEKNNP